MNKFCTNCGHKLPDAAKFCPNCGTRVVDLDDTSNYEEDSPIGKDEASSEEDDAFDTLLEKAQAGDVEAQLSLGNIYYSGDGVEKDLFEANKWYFKAAEQGNI